MERLLSWPFSIGSWQIDTIWESVSYFFSSPLLVLGRGSVKWSNILLLVGYCLQQVPIICHYKVVPQCGGGCMQTITRAESWQIITLHKFLSVILVHHHDCSTTTLSKAGVHWFFSRLLHCASNFRHFTAFRHGGLGKQAAGWRWTTPSEETQ